jgi:hypothetical protein
LEEAVAIADKASRGGDGLGTARAGSDDRERRLDVMVEQGPFNEAQHLLDDLLAAGMWK